MQPAKNRGPSGLDLDRREVIEASRLDRSTSLDSSQMGPARFGSPRRTRSRPLVASVAVLMLSCGELLGDVELENVPKDSSAQSSESSSVPSSMSLAPSPAPASTDVATTMPQLEPGHADRVCEDGTFRCSGADLEYCGATGWMPWQRCGNPALCESEPAGRCLPAACAAGEQRCEGAALQICNEKGSGWVDLDVCRSPAHCDSASVECLPAPCRSGQSRCNAGVVEACRRDQLGWDIVETCASPALCTIANETSRAACASPACPEREYRCLSDGTLQVCALDRTGFVDFAKCGSASLCDGAQGRCQPPMCSPGEHRCTSDGEILVCNAGSSGFVPTSPRLVCGNAEVCNAARGVCEPRENEGGGGARGGGPPASGGGRSQLPSSDGNRNDGGDGGRSGRSR